MSVVTPIADIRQCDWHVRFGPFQLSRKNINNEDDESSHGKHGVDADQNPHGPLFEDARAKHQAADQRCHHDQRRGNNSERAGTFIQPTRRSAQREKEAT